MTEKRTTEDQSQRRTVLHVRSSSGRGGGPDKTVLNSARYLDSRGYDCLCAYLTPPDSIEHFRRQAADAGAALVSIPDRGPWDGTLPGRLARLCRDHAVDVWHSHDYKTNLLGLLVSRFWPMKRVSTVHGWGVHGGRTRLYYWLDRRCLRFYDRVICVSTELAEVCQRHAVPPSACAVIPNGIDTRLYQRRRSAAEAKLRLGIPPETLLVGALGRLSPEKGFDLLVSTVDRLLRESRPLLLWIGGEGPHREVLERLIAESGHADRIRLLGHLEDVRTHLEAMDVFVLSSLREGLPNALLEAMAMEVPVVATAVSGVPEVIEHQKNGLLVEPGSTVELERCIRQLLDDRQLGDRLAAAARQTVEERFAFGSRMDRMASLYDSLFSAAEALPNGRARGRRSGAVA